MHNLNSILFGGFLAPLIKGHAYLDPGTGSFIIQIVIAAVVGGLFLLRGYVGKALNFVRNLFNRSENHPDDKQ